MKKIIVDTNVFIDGFFSLEETSSSKILRELDSNDSRLVFSLETIGELLYILKRHCNSLEMESEDAIEILTEAVTLFYQGKSINTRRTKSPVQAKDADDQMFIDAAFESSADFIITFDKKSGLLDIDLDKVNFKCFTPEDYLEHIKDSGNITTIHEFED